MYLEKEDWAEPSCCFRPAADFTEIPHGNAGRKTPVRQVIEEFDSYIERDETAQASACLEHWLAEYEVSGDWGSQVTILNEMMGLYRSTGEKEKGLEAVRRGLALVGEHQMAESVSGGTTFLNAATTMKAFGKAAEAILYYEQAFRAYGRSLAPEDYRFGGLFNNMALAYEDLGEFLKAEVYYKKAMEIMERLQPGSILEMAVTWVNLAVLYEKWGKDDQVDECMEQAALGFHSSDVKRDGYYAFNCRKCAATFGHFGYFRMEKELREAADNIYQMGGCLPSR